MKSWMRQAVVLAGLALGAPAGAATVSDYTSFHVLGDSLSDRGNVYRATFGRVPASPPYWRGRFSNGPVWAEHVEGAFAAEDLPTGNHAWGGAKANRDGDFNPDLAIQARRYRSIDSDRRGERSLVALWAGANDIMGSVGGSDVGIVGRRAANAVGGVAGSLRRSGVGDLMIFNMPDLGVLPAYGDRDDLSLSATLGSRAYNRQLGRQVAGLRAAGANVTVVNAYGLLAAVIADPTRFGLRNTDTPCLSDGERCSPRQAAQRAFWDDQHPSRVLHEGLADAALRALAATPASSVAVAASPAPVPLPAPAALLAGAMLWLGVAARRRRRASPCP